MNKASVKEVFENNVEKEENNIYAEDKVDEAFMEPVIEVIAPILKSSELPDISQVASIPTGRICHCLSNRR